jgi:hypothetical protein
VRVRGNYEHGEPVGKWSAWDENGGEIWSRDERAPSSNKVAREEKRAPGASGN